MIKERLELAKERITEIKNESNVGSFSGFFEKTAAFLVLLMKQRELVESGELIGNSQSCNKYTVLTALHNDEPHN